MSVLIVEDNPVTSKLLEVNLEKHNYRTIVAHTGREALEYLRAMPEIQLVITDVMMPEMDGLELLRTMKEHLEWQAIPVIISTSRADVETVQQAAGMGCRHYVLKPIKAADLLQKVRQVLDSEKPILRNKLQVMAELRLDLSSYEQMAQVLTVLVSAKIGQLEQYMDEDPPAGEVINLMDLAEGAALLGAVRVTDILERLEITSERSQGTMQKADCAVLLREVKLLLEALTTPSQRRRPLYSS